VTIVSAYVSCAAWNTVLWIPNPATPLPISIDVPASIWVLAGIVSTHLVGNALILSRSSSGELTAEGSDLLNLQVLLFQLAAIVVYIVALGRMIFATDPNVPIAQFPIIPSGFLALLGITTGTALAKQAIPKLT